MLALPCELRCPCGAVYATLGIVDGADAEQRYRCMGLTVNHYDDEPGHVYRYHRHGPTYLFTIAGVGLMKLGEDADATHHVLLPGQELLVGSDVLHGGVAGPDGWTYLAASAPPSA